MSSLYSSKKLRGGEVRVISFFQVCNYQNVLALSFATKAFEEEQSNSLLTTPYYEWFSSIVSCDVIL